MSFGGGNDVSGVLVFVGKVGCGNSGMFVVGRTEGGTERDLSDVDGHQVAVVNGVVYSDDGGLVDGIRGQNDGGDTMFAGWFLRECHGGQGHAQEHGDEQREEQVFLHVGSSPCCRNTTLA